MREELKKYLGHRGTFYGTFQRFGKRTAYRGLPMTTILLTNIKDADGIEIEDHVWFTMGTRFARIGLAPGDTVRFCARVTPYVKGYRGRREDCDLPPVTSDYRLSFPTKIEKVPAAEHHRGVVGPEDD